MDAQSEGQFSRSLAALAVVLTLVAGYVDAIGYLILGHVYVANMSGNSIALGIHGSRLDGPQVWHYLWPIISFGIGLMVSRILVSCAIDSGWRSVAAPAVALEAAALLGFMAVPANTAGIFLAASAMGIQAATLSRFNGATVYTSFVTGSLVKFAEHAAELLVPTRRSPSHRAAPGRQTAWFAGIWLAYVAGAFAGATSLDALGRPSVIIAIGVLLVVIALDLRWPSKLDQAVP